MPWTNRIPIRKAIYAAATGEGIAIRRAATLGRNASATKMTPITTPTRRAAMPVTSVSGMLLEYVVLGSVPSNPESRFPTPSEFKAPCTTRKSVACGRRRETR